MKRIYPFILLLTSLNAFANGYVIGNGGDAVNINGQLYARDLVENGIENRPYFGELLDSSLVDELERLPIDENELPFSKQLLHRKLSDLNSIHPYLGHYILEALKSYTWSAVNVPLATTINQGEIFLGLNKGLVQIANRLDRTIRIHKKSWSRLNNEQRVVILLHEAIYSLIKPTCENSFCYQSGRMARAITAALFSKENFVSANPQHLLLKYFHFLAIPSVYTFKEESEEEWTLSLIDNTNREVLITAFSPSHHQIEFSDGPYFLNNLIRYYCHENPLSRMKDLKLQSTFKKSPFRAAFIRYNTETVIDEKRYRGHQLRLKISRRLPKERTSTLEYRYQKSNKEKCVKTIFTHYQMLLENL